MQHNSWKNPVLQNSQIELCRTMRKLYKALLCVISPFKDFLSSPEAGNPGFELPQSPELNVYKMAF